MAMVWEGRSERNWPAPEQPSPRSKEHHVGSLWGGDAPQQRKAQGSKTESHLTLCERKVIKRLRARQIIGSVTETGTPMRKPSTPSKGDDGWGRTSVGTRLKKTQKKMAHRRTSESSTNGGRGRTEQKNTQNTGAKRFRLAQRENDRQISRGGAQRLSQPEEGGGGIGGRTGVERGRRALLFGSRRVTVKIWKLNRKARGPNDLDSHGGNRGREE